MWGNKIKLPENFIFKGDYLSSSVSVLVGFSKLFGKKVQLDFSNIKKVGKGDLMVLMAQLEKTIFNRKKRISIIGKMPLKVKQLLKEKAHHLSITKENFDKYAVAEKTNKANPLIVANIVSEMQKIGIKKNNADGFGFYERIEALLTEVVGNAVEHGIKNQNINYWICSEKDGNFIKITFVDMGMGIAKSHKKARLLLKYRLLGRKGENKIILDSLYKRLSSSTKKPGRGKGLPEIREIIEREWVSNFLLISNRTAIEFKDSKFIDKNVRNFEGTYYSWTISKYNFEKWKSTKLT